MDCFKLFDPKDTDYINSKDFKNEVLYQYKLPRVRIWDRISGTTFNFELLYQEQLSVGSLPSYLILIWFMSGVLQ